MSTLKESQKDSPQHQEALIREAAAREGIEINYVYEDRDTATSIVSRKDVQRMIEDAKRGEIRSLWFASLSRFSRDALDAISLKRILVNALGIRVVSIEDGYDSAVKDDELLFGIKSVVNQNTSGDISISSRRGIEKSAAKGNFIGSIAPYGYKKVTKDGRKTLEIVPDQAEVVKLIYNLYLNGYGDKSIVRYLNGENDDGIVYPTYKGGLWNLSSVQRILQNENYTGYTVYGRHTSKIVYDDITDLMNRRRKLVMKPQEKWKRTTFQTHEAIISKEDFAKAQELRLLRGGGKRGGRRKFVNVFAKMVFCQECGTAMVMGKSISKNKEYRYLICSKRRMQGKKGCSNHLWLPYYEVRDQIIGEILDRIRSFLNSDGVDQLQAERKNNNFIEERQQIEKHIKDNRKLLFEIRRQKMLGEIDDEQYEFEKEMYEKEIEEGEKKLSVIELEERKVLNVSELKKDARKALESLTDPKTYDDVERTRAFLLNIVKRIEISRDGEVTIQTYL